MAEGEIMDERIIMTQKTYDALKEQLDTLIRVKRPQIVERIAEARSHGDLSENAEYDAAREEQRSNEGKIAEIEGQLKMALIQEESHDTSYVHLNSVVTVLDKEFNEKIEYTITSVTDYDAVHNKISTESPVGSALMRKRVGDVVTITCPDGSTYDLEILEIK